MTSRSPTCCEQHRMNCHQGRACPIHRTPMAQHPFTDSEFFGTSSKPRPLIPWQAIAGLAGLAAGITLLIGSLA